MRKSKLLIALLLAAALVLSACGYPGGERGATRSLWLIDTERGIMTEPVRVDTVIPPVVDIRCDLHVRWSPSGKLLSFDSTHTGRRTSVLLTAEEIGIPSAGL